MKKRFLLLTAFLLVAGLGLHAQTDSQSIPASAIAASVPEDTLSSTPALTISGYVDAYYQYNVNRPSSGLNGGRIFDLPHNSFSLGLVQTVLTYSVKRLTVVADLTFGPNADLGNFGNENTARIIKQAYISYDFTPRLTFTAGQFGTHIGYELIDAPLNTNYSLSYLFGNGPFYHTGAKVDYQLGKRAGLMLGVVNGWDALVDHNDKKSLVAQLSLMPAEGFDVYLNWIGGDEHSSLSNFGSTEGSYTSLFDLTTSFQLSPFFKAGINAAYGSFSSGDSEPAEGDAWSANASWGGAALYLGWELNDMVGLNLRGEYFNDPQGVRYFGPVEVNALTLTGDIKLAEGRLLLKPELRYDRAKEAFFEDSQGGLKRTQTSLGAAFIYAF
jgi:hypothetical protein